MSSHEQHRQGRAARAARIAWRLLRDPAYRQMIRLAWWPGAAAFQPFNETRPDRYPVIFRCVQERLGAESPVRILSFGCATGEEVFSLRRYFPRATIKGIDINSGNIARARRTLRRSPDAGLSFALADSTAGEPDAIYDAIFCMAVLRHGDLAEPGVTRCDHLIRFADFAATIRDFHRCLKPGGLLVVRHSNFRVSDVADVAFELVRSVPLQGPRRTPIFGPNNRLVPDADYPDTVFRKL